MTMKCWTLLLPSLLVAAALMLTGCPGEQTPPAGPGADSTDSDDSADSADDGEDGNDNDPEKQYQLTLPSGETSVTQGEEVKLQVTVDRGSKFLEAVTVKFEPPAGLTCDPASVKAAKDKDTVETILKADATAKVGEHNIKVTGTSDKGYTTSGMIDITVEKKEESNDGTADGADN